MTPKPAPPHCGQPDCDPTTRLLDSDDGEPVRRCPRCHPLAPNSLPALHERRSALKLALDEVDRQIAAQEAPEWIRGPGPVRT